MFNNWRVDWWLPGFRREPKKPSPATEQIKQVEQLTQVQSPERPAYSYTQVREFITNSDENVIVLAPRRAGKTQMAVEIVSDYLGDTDNHVLVVAPTLRMCEEINRRADLNRRIPRLNHATTIQRLRGIHPGLIIVDEMAYVREAVQMNIVDRFPRARKILFSTPTTYDPRNPSLLKRLWDNPNDYIKIRMAQQPENERFVEEMRQAYRPEDYQTEILGEWHIETTGSGTGNIDYSSLIGVPTYTFDRNLGE